MDFLSKIESRILRDLVEPPPSVVRQIRQSIESIRTAHAGEQVYITRVAKGERRRRALTLRAQGLKIAEIARRMDCHPATVRYWLRGKSPTSRPTANQPGEMVGIVTARQPMERSG